MDKSWKRTRYSLYLGALDEAIICNLCAILFVVFRTEFGLTFEQLGRLILVNFCVQMAADLINGALINKTPARRIILIGYSGGALLCGLIINHYQEELNIVRWITIAGLLNHTRWTRHFGYNPLKKS